MLATTVSTLSYLVWALFLAAALVLWWMSYGRPASVAQPSEVLVRLVTHPVVRVLLVLGVMWLGWHLFAR
jgi:hypothetical protein